MKELLEVVAVELEERAMVSDFEANCELIMTSWESIDKGLDLILKADHSIQSTKPSESTPGRTGDLGTTVGGREYEESQRVKKGMAGTSVRGNMSTEGIGMQNLSGVGSVSDQSLGNSQGYKTEYPFVLDFHKKNKGNKKQGGQNFMDFVRDTLAQTKQTDQVFSVGGGFKRVPPKRPKPQLEPVAELPKAISKTAQSTATKMELMKKFDEERRRLEPIKVKPVVEKATNVKEKLGRSKTIDILKVQNKQLSNDGHKQIGKSDNGKKLSMTKPSKSSKENRLESKGLREQAEDEIADRANVESRSSEDDCLAQNERGKENTNKDNLKGEQERDALIEDESMPAKQTSGKMEILDHYSAVDSRSQVAQLDPVASLPILPLQIEKVEDTCYQQGLPNPLNERVGETDSNKVERIRGSCPIEPLIYKVISLVQYSTWPASKPVYDDPFADMKNRILQSTIEHRPVDLHTDISSDDQQNEEDEESDERYNAKHTEVRLKEEGKTPLSKIVKKSDGGTAKSFIVKLKSEVKGRETFSPQIKQEKSGARVDSKSAVGKSSVADKPKPNKSKQAKEVTSQRNGEPVLPQTAPSKLPSIPPLTRRLTPHLVSIPEMQNENESVVLQVAEPKKERKIEKPVPKPIPESVYDKIEVVDYSEVIPSWNHIFGNYHITKNDCFDILGQMRDVALQTYPASGILHSAQRHHEARACQGARHRLHALAARTQ
jgi:hypothetical protein